MVFDAETSNDSIDSSQGATDITENLSGLSFKRSDSVDTDSTLSEMPTSEPHIAAGRSEKGVPICYVLGVCVMGVFAGVFVYMSGDNLIVTNYSDSDGAFANFTATVGATASGMRATVNQTAASHESNPNTPTNATPTVRETSILSITAKEAEHKRLVDNARDLLKRVSWDYFGSRSLHIGSQRNRKIFLALSDPNAGDS